MAGAPHAPLAASADVPLKDHVHVSAVPAPTTLHSTTRLGVRGAANPATGAGVAIHVTCSSAAPLASGVGTATPALGAGAATPAMDAGASGGCPPGTDVAGNAVVYDEMSNLAVEMTDPKFDETRSVVSEQSGLAAAKVGRGDATLQRRCVGVWVCCRICQHACLLPLKPCPAPAYRHAQVLKEASSLLARVHDAVEHKE